MTKSGFPGEVALRHVREEDLPILFEHQMDPEATAMAAFPSREREAFQAHWAKILADESCVARAIVADGRLAGNIGSFGPQEERLVGYWIGKEHWGQGIATRALAAFLSVERTRPLYAHVVKHNVGLIRVLEKCGFALDEARTRSAASAGVGPSELIFVLAEDTDR